MHYAGVDPRGLPERPPDARRDRAGDDGHLDPRQAYTADAVASLDEPSDSPIDAIDYDVGSRSSGTVRRWTSRSSVAAMAGDEVAAFSGDRDGGDRAWSGMTGSIPAYRGRGLAKLAKWEALRRCADAGIAAAFTSKTTRTVRCLPSTTGSAIAG